MVTARLILVLGGARSGKSRCAERLATVSGRRVTVVATAGVGDAEMAARIARHRADRSIKWTTVEEQLDLASAIAALPGEGVAIVDCLTLWLSNLMESDRNIEIETETLAKCLEIAPCPIVLVSNETGLGIVPATPLGRDFRDAQGRLNQRLAQACDAVLFMAAGLPLVLKPAPERPEIRLG